MLMAFFVVTFSTNTASYLGHKFKVGVVLLSELLQQPHVLFLHVFKCLPSDFHLTQHCLLLLQFATTTTSQSTGKVNISL